MNGIIHYETFILTGLLLNITPGNDTIFILSRSMAQGKKAGFMSVLGIATGSLIHTILAAFGLSIIIAKSILVFSIIKYAGAAYLLYIGYQMLTDKTRLNTDVSFSEKSINLKKIYRDGVITNVLNPKVALFFISFLPQFIDSGLKNTIVPFITLGITFTITGTIWCLFLANFSSIIFAKLKYNKKLSNYINKSCGAVLIGLGIKVALTNKN
ncbi:MULTISPECIES: LysE family translocator [unclassified Flavobacterium]|jgi:RhtB (resistance to homoserine/threonine) family protein|uniref:LysE family translocator n=1 Tax=unclassified Flavobacterium TaxID=196869 RepID=UPI00057FCEB2|nr:MULTISPECIES: LysE family translocator [unclassified Flavobacterium]KIA93994.1 homoserine lactone transporter [Flavobacterium sp. KMS]KIC02766.1 homoserine lactone transporter [Flavobacterium sp. JRM]OUL61690.1 homoserine lactone transporter [Flavobacterium sp. AJR]